MTGASENFLALGMELLFAGVIVIIAGISDETGKAVDFFLVGLLLVFLIAHPAVTSKFSATVGSIQSQAFQPKGTTK
jgi:hypothetical protein